MNGTVKFLNWLTSHEIEILAIFLAVLCLALIIFFTRYIQILKHKKNLALRSSLARSFFIQKVGYELKNSLNGIIGFSDMLEAGYFGDLNVNQRQRIMDINKCGKQVQNLVNDFLDIAKGESGHIEIVSSEVNVTELLKKILRNKEDRIKSNQLNVINHVTKPYYLKGDTIKLAQIIRSILSNAIKFTSKGGHITIKENLRPRKFFVLEISDTGSGMSQDELDTAFLYPDTDGKTNGMNGIGLGLPLAKLFIELHGGSIELESEESVGTTVRLIFPVAMMVVRD